MSSDPYIAPSNPISRAGAGVVAGIAGGLVLAIVLTAFGHIRAVGNLIGQPSLSVGWVVLLVISAIAGALYGAFAGRAVSAQIVPAVGIGICYGGVWWLLLQVIAVPARSGDGLFHLGDDAMVVLGAYAVFGIVLGIVYAMTGPRRRVPYRRSRYQQGVAVVAVPQTTTRTRRRRRRS